MQPYFARTLLGSPQTSPTALSTLAYRQSVPLAVSPGWAVCQSRSQFPHKMLAVPEALQHKDNAQPNRFASETQQNTCFFV